MNKILVFLTILLIVTSLMVSCSSPTEQATSDEFQLEIIVKDSLGNPT